jgi:hypothetical protein
MIPIVKNNFVRVMGTGSTWTCEFDSFPKNFNNLFVESCLAAEEVYSLRQGKVYLMYGGGIDGEYTLSVFRHLGMEVIPVIVQLSKYNIHDTEYAFKFCQTHNIDPIVIDIDFDKFVKSGMMLDYAKQYRSEIYHRPAIMYAISKLDGTIIMGDNEPYICKNDQGSWDYQLHEHDYVFVNYFEQNNILGTPHLGCWSPGINAAFLTDPVMIELANNLHPGKLSSFSSKYKIYNNSSNFNLEVRPKYTGYELIEQSEIFKHESFKELEDFGKTCNGYFKEDYFKFIDRLSNGINI